MSDEEIRSLERAIKRSGRDVVVVDSDVWVAAVEAIVKAKAVCVEYMSVFSGAPDTVQKAAVSVSVAHSRIAATKDSIATAPTDYDHLVAVFGTPDEERGVYLPGEPPGDEPPPKHGRRFFARWDNGPGKRNVGDFFEIVFGAAGNFEEITNP